MTIKKLKEWVEYAGFTFIEDGPNSIDIVIGESFSIGETIPGISYKQTYTPFQHFYIKDSKAYLDPNIHGIPDLQISDREILKNILTKGLFNLNK